MFTVESKTVRVRFQEGNDKKTYAIQWTELLTTSETPFESLSELTPGTEVLAPYYDSGDKINYSIAIIGGKRRKEGEYIIYGKIEKRCTFAHKVNCQYRRVCTKHPPHNRVEKSCSKGFLQSCHLSQILSPNLL